MRRASVVTQQLGFTEDENGNIHPRRRDSTLLGANGATTTPQDDLKRMQPSHSFSNFWYTVSEEADEESRKSMTSRPSFISLMLIASDDELNRLPRLPAPLQVEAETYQKCGWEDEPKLCSHLPVLHSPESPEDVHDHSQGGIIHSIIHLPDRIRKISAEKDRFNVFALPDQERVQLKNLYVY